MFGAIAKPSLGGDEAKALFHKYCVDCHAGATAAGNLDLASLLGDEPWDATLVFENIATQKMPPADAEAPADEQRRKMLAWLAHQQPEPAPIEYRRISRHEFVHSVNDLLGTQLDLSSEIPEDRGGRDFDSDRRIQLSREMLESYFAVADKMLERALPTDGFADEQVWMTNKLKDSHHTYSVYVRDYEDGVLFSWTRANNGNNYSFFYDNFDPPTAGWYELTFESAKVGDLQGDISIQVYAGKYYYADDRPQPQRLLDVISVGSHKLESAKFLAYLRPGENVSVHCFSKDNFREGNPQRGAYIRQMTARGPVQDAWPPKRYEMLFGLPLSFERRGASHASERNNDPAGPLRQSTRALVKSEYVSNLKRIGGSITVSSFQVGMEKEKMQDGSNRTFWHTRFKPTLAKPPHYVILENPNAHIIEGLSYATWSGGNGNGQVQKFEVYASDDGKMWGEPIAAGGLERGLAHEQPISFPTPTRARFVKFVATQSFSIDGRSLASIGKLDVIASVEETLPMTKVSVSSTAFEDMRRVIKRFAERAFSTELSPSELQPYVDVAVRTLQREGDFVEAAKVGFKAIICSHRFLMAPGEHSTQELAQAAALARILWLSIPDESLGDAKAPVRDKISRMLDDARSKRMVESLCNQWLNLRSWSRVSPSLKLYPRYDDLLEHYLPLETKAYLAYLIRENRPVGELIDSNYSFLNQRLAEHYGVPGVIGQQLRKVDFAPDIPRGGLLTMGSVLKVTTDGFQTSPILRGAWISKNLVGTPISPPPETVKAIDPEVTDGRETLREQIDRHTNNESCYACHKSIDPYGFALESFDATGQWRTKYRTKLPHQGTFLYRPQGYYRQTTDVDAAGAVHGEEFKDIHELKRLLLSDDRKVAYNFAKQLFQYASGCAPSLRQQLALLKMTSRGRRMRDLVVDVLAYSLEEG